MRILDSGDTTNSLSNSSAEVVFQAGQVHGNVNIVHQATDTRDSTFRRALREAARSQCRTQLALLVGARSLTVPWEVLTPADGIPLAGTGSIGSLAGVLAAGRQLTVLGEPGSGKTVLAMRLQRHLLSEAGPIPIRFPLASWDPHIETLYVWMVDFLRDLFPDLTASRTDVELLQEITGSGILPILDGYDEIKLPLQQRAKEAIEVAMHDLPIVLTSRSRTASGADIVVPKLSGAVEIRLRPVTGEDAADYLRSSDGPTTRTWAPVADELDRRDTRSALTDALSSPLMVWLARTVYSPSADNRPVDAAQLLDTAAFPDRASIEQHLLANLVPSTFTRGLATSDGEPRERSAPQDAERWLTFLAARIRTHGQLAFWVVPTFVPKLLLSFAVALVAGCALGVLAGVSAELAVALEASLLLGAFFGFGFSRGYTTRRKRDYYEKGRTGYGGRVRGTEPDLLAHLMRMGAVVSASGVTVVVSIIIGAALRLSHSILDDFDPATLAPRLLVPLIGAAVVATGAVGYLGGVIAGMLLQALPKIDRSYTGAQAKTPGAAVRKDRGSAIVIGVLGWLVNGVLLAAVFAVSLGLRYALIGFVGGLGAGVTANFVFSVWIRYRAAQIWLALRGHLPWRFMSFLDEAHELGVLRQNGNFYEFRHARLQESLAAQDCPTVRRRVRSGK